MSLLLRRFLQGVCRQPFLVSPALTTTQSRGLRSKRDIIHEREALSLKWAEPLIERAKQKPDEGPREPHQLHVVYRTKTLIGRPWWEKEIMDKLQLTTATRSTPVIHKNTPSVNKLLRDVKHLIRILPLKMTQGLPEDPSDFQHCYINSKGELITKRKLKHLEPDTSSLVKREKWHLSDETLRKKLDKTLKEYDLHSEYHHTHYEWKRNEDGKEYRYNFNKNIRKYRY